MNISEFMTRFSTEIACKEYYRDVRMKEGVTCKKCGCKKHYWLISKWLFQCSNCGFRTTLRSGTVMENSKLPFKTWFFIMMFMTNTKKGVSACELQKQLGHKRYNTIWSVMHRLRKTMGKRDDLYKLNDMIEFDEAYFEKTTPEKTRNNLKRGKGSQRQVNVAVMAESVPLEDIETGKVSKHCQYFKMKALKTHKSKEINEIILKTIDKKSIVFTDKSTSYIDITGFIDAHVVVKSTKQATKETLRWVHIAISNAKRTLLGIYHQINGEYLQSYLDEFVYKLNRRYFKSIFERLVVASVYPYWYNND